MAKNFTKYTIWGFSFFFLLACLSVGMKEFMHKDTHTIGYKNCTQTHLNIFRKPEKRGYVAEITLKEIWNTYHCHCNACCRRRHRHHCRRIWVNVSRTTQVFSLLFLFIFSTLTKWQFLENMWQIEFYKPVPTFVKVMQLRMNVFVERKRIMKYCDINHITN